MIRNIVFDVGKVLVSFEPETYMRQLGFSKEVMEVVDKAMFKSPTWVASDRGTVTPDAALEAYIAAAPEYKEEITLAHHNVGGTVELYPYVMEWLGSLKEKGYGIYILSNYGELLLEQTREKMEFLKLADGAIFSYIYKMMKPEREIYELLCEKYNLSMEECVFIDDRPENIEGAKAVGMQGICFTSYEQASKELEELL